MVDVQLERLRKAHRLAHAADLIVEHPVPIGGPWLVFQATGAPVSVGRDSTRTTIPLRNVGDEACQVLEVTADVGVSMTDSIVGSVLPALTAARESALLALKCDPFSLPRSQKSVGLRVRVRSLVQSHELSFPFTLPIERLTRPEPVLLLETQELEFTNVPLEGFHSFQTVAPDARAVLLHIEDPPAARKSYPMISSGGDRFELVLALSAGTNYAYRFEVDGTFRLDEQVAVQEHVPGVGVCSGLYLEGQKTQRIRVRNGGDKDLRVSLVSEASWLVVLPQECSVPGSGTAEITVGVRPEGIKAGRHEAHVTLRSNDPDASEPRVRVVLSLSVRGPVPVLASTYDLGIVCFGAQARKTIDITNVGTEVLRGRLSSEHPTINASQFEVAGGETVAVPVTVHWGADQPAGPQDVVTRVIVQSDTLVAGRRQLSAVVRYHLTLMHMVPGRIDFGDVTVGSRRTVDFRATRGDEQPVEVTVDPHQDLPPWLSLESDATGGARVRIEGDKWSGQTDYRFSLAVEIRDRTTGLLGILPVQGEFVVPKLVLRDGSISLGRVHKGTTKSQPLRVANSGRGQLVFKEIVLDHDWLGVEVRKTDPGSEASLHLSAKTPMMKTGRHRGLVALVTNDPKRPRVEVPVEVRVVD